MKFHIDAIVKLRDLDRGLGYYSLVQFGFMGDYYTCKHTFDGKRIITCSFKNVKGPICGLICKMADYIIQDHKDKFLKNRDSF